MKFEKKVSWKVAIALVLVAILVSSTIVYTFAVSPGSTFTISLGIYPGAPSYTVWREGSNCFAKDVNGFIAYSGTNAGQIINWALGNLTSGRTWKEKVLLKGNFPLTIPLSLASYTILDIQGKLTVATNIDAIQIIGTVGTYKVFVDVCNGIIVGPGVPIATSNVGINVSYTEHVIIEKVDVSLFYRGIQWNYCYEGNGVFKSEFHNNVYNNINLYQTNALTILSCVLHDASDVDGAALMIEYRSGLNNILSCIIEGNKGMGAWIKDSHDNLLEGNWFENCQSVAIYESYADGEEKYVGNNRFLNNYFDSNDGNVTLRRSQITLYKSLGDKIIGNTFFNGAGYTYTQAAILLESGAQDTEVDLNKHDAGTGTMAFIVNSGTRTKFWRNPTFVTENSGSALILNGHTNVTFAHGLAGSPVLVTLGATQAEVAGAWWIFVNSTHIRILVTNAVSDNRAVSWIAEYHP